MNYEIRQFDTPLLRFSATEDTSEPEIKILWQNEARRDLFPLDMAVSGEGISKWLRHRTIPKNRAYVRNFLSKCGLNLNRPMNIIKVSKGLSLNDCYWVVEEGFTGKFDDFNLYDNRFSRILALIAFTGYGSSVRTSLASCPEFTTNGMLPKCWRRENGIIKLYKGGTSGASNTGNQKFVICFIPIRWRRPWGSMRYRMACPNGKGFFVPPANCLPARTMLSSRLAVLSHPAA